MITTDNLPSNSSMGLIKLTSPLVFIQELMEIMLQIRWWIFAAFILVIADLWFGIRVSKMKGIKIRYSSAGRRTLNKFMDYFLYILLGTSLAMALYQSYEVIKPMVVTSTILAFCYAFEIDSIYDHICYLHGKKKAISIWKALWLIITFRFSELKDIDNLKPIEDNPIKPQTNE